jgi:hypothetical protein
MTLNFPGPFQLRVNYQVQGQPHTQRLNLALSTDPGPGFAFTAYSTLQRNLASVGLQAAADAWIVLLRPMFNSTNANFNDIELWKYAPASEDATFHAAYAVGLAGTNATATVTAGQARMSLISTLGGAHFIDFMESIYPPGVTDAFPFASVEVGAVATFLLGTTNWVLARDGSHPAAARRWNPGQNEALWKKINRL